tara:strand:- start:24 stop:293 length:270 start_codon:yes stop_codon:yes gene_type:complete
MPKIDMTVETILKDGALVDLDLKLSQDPSALEVNIETIEDPKNGIIIDDFEIEASSKTGIAIDKLEIEAALKTSTIEMDEIEAPSLIKE